MSHDMGEIEAALDEFHQAAADMDTQWIPERDKLLALIREKLAAARREPPPAGTRQITHGDFDVDLHNDGTGTVDGLHFTMTWKGSGRGGRMPPATCAKSLYILHDKDIDEALRLMRARPAATDSAYAKLHKAAGQLWAGMQWSIDKGEIQPTTRLKCFMDILGALIEEVPEPEEPAATDTAAADLAKYGPAPTMADLTPSPEWLARHEAAGELLRAAKEAYAWLVECDQDDEANKLWAAIEAAERAGIA